MQKFERKSKYLKVDSWKWEYPTAYSKERRLGW
jgi:hypothetical protein